MVLMFRADTERIEAAIAELTRVQKTLPNQLREDAFDEAQAAAERARRGVAKVGVQGQKGPRGPYRNGPGKHRGMRDEIAAGVRVVRGRGQSHDFSVSVVSQNPVGLSGVAKGLNFIRKGWRHPVFGNRNVWRGQRGTYAWFNDAMYASRQPLTDRYEQRLDDAAHDLGRL